MAAARRRGLAAAADGTLNIAGQVDGNLTASLTQVGPRARRATVTAISRPARSVNGPTTQASPTAGQFRTDEPKRALRRASVHIQEATAQAAVLTAELQVDRTHFDMTWSPLHIASMTARGIVTARFVRA